MRKLKFINILFALAMGLGGELYLAVPSLGVMPMLDITAYATSVLLTLMSWGKMGKNIRRAILLGMGWSAAAIFAGLLSGDSFRDVLKEVVVCSSSWTILALAWWVLRKDARLYLFYLIGYGVGGYIGLYHFKQGVWLATEIMHEGADLMEVIMDKQKYPVYAHAWFFGAVLAAFVIIKKLPVFAVVAGSVYCAFFLLTNGGSRSGFGFYMLASIAGLSIKYFKQIARRVLRSKMALCITAGSIVFAVFTVYKVMATTGALGEGEMHKYEDEFTNRSSAEAGLVGRGNYVNVFRNFFQKPWGWGPHYGCHAVFTSAMSREGVLGIVFWVYFLMQVSWFVCKRLGYAGSYGTFLSAILIITCWNCLGSPFGARHQYFVLMAFIALCQDNPYYGVGTIFDERVLGRQRMMPWQGGMRRWQMS